MSNEYGSSDDRTTDEQGGSSPDETTSKRASAFSYQGGGDDTDLQSQPSGFKSPLIGPGGLWPRNDATGLDEGSQYTSEESAGETTVPVGGVEAMTETAEFNEEVGNAEGQESSEEYYEATPEQLKESGEESGEEAGEEGLFDIVGGLIGGLFGGEAAEIMEAGTAIESGQEAGGGQEELFPFLAALVPTLISSIGPSVAKMLMRKLSPLARQGIKRLAAGVTKPGGKAKPRGRNILSVFAKLLETAQESGSESGPEVGPEFNPLIEEAASTLEVIIGTDDRKRVLRTAYDPWRRICALRITFPSGQTYRGTGFFIGLRAVATAGHCVYLHNQGGWARKVEVIPGANGTSRPYGSAVSTTLRSVRGWVSGKKPENDYGCVVLPVGAFGGRNLGRFGFQPFDSQVLLARKAILAGYPGDKPFAEMWGMKRRIKIVTPKTLVYDIDTVGGQSGAPVYIKHNGKRFVVGIHNYGNSAGNSATRVTPAVCDRLKKWSVI